MLLTRNFDSKTIFCIINLKWMNEWMMVMYLKNVENPSLKRSGNMLKQLVSGIKTLISILFTVLFWVAIIKNIKKLIFIEIKKMERFVRNLLNEIKVLKNWVADLIYLYFQCCSDYSRIIFLIF